MIYPLLEEFFTLHADIEINLFSETLVGGFEALAEHRTDIAIGFLPPNDNHDIESYYYKTVRWAFVVGKNHPLLAKKTPLIKTDVEIYRSVVVRDSVKNSAAQSYRLFSKKPLLRVPSVQDKIKAQKAGLGVGYLPVLSIRDELASGELVALDISGVENNTELFVSWHKAEKGKALQWFVNKLRESAE
jgi:DNA-binding transcriptional LysR family regulator